MMVSRSVMHPTIRELGSVTSHWQHIRMEDLDWLVLIPGHTRQCNSPSNSVSRYNWILVAFPVRVVSILNIRYAIDL